MSSHRSVLALGLASALGWVLASASELGMASGWAPESVPAAATDSEMFHRRHHTPQSSVSLPRMPPESLESRTASPPEFPRDVEPQKNVVFCTAPCALTDRGPDPIGEVDLKHVAADQFLHAHGPVCPIRIITGHARCRFDDDIDSAPQPETSTKPDHERV